MDLTTPILTALSGGPRTDPGPKLQKAQLQVSSGPSPDSRFRTIPPRSIHLSGSGAGLRRSVRFRRICARRQSVGHGGHRTADRCQSRAAGALLSRRRAPVPPYHGHTRKTWQVHVSAIQQELVSLSQTSVNGVHVQTATWIAAFVIN